MIDLALTISRGLKNYEEKLAKTGFTAREKVCVLFLQLKEVIGSSLTALILFKLCVAQCFGKEVKLWPRVDRL